MAFCRKESYGAPGGPSPRAPPLGCSLQFFVILNIDAQNYIFNVEKLLLPPVFFQGVWRRSMQRVIVARAAAVGPAAAAGAAAGRGNAKAALD